jgi:hypothetical protein
VTSEDPGDEGEGTLVRQLVCALADEFHLPEELVSDARLEVRVRLLGQRLVGDGAGRAGHRIDAADFLVNRRDGRGIADVDREPSSRSGCGQHIVPWLERLVHGGADTR